MPVAPPPSTQKAEPAAPTTPPEEGRDRAVPPAPVEASPVTDASVDELNQRIKPLQTVYFDYDSSDLDDTSRAILQANADWLKKNPKRDDPHRGPLRRARNDQVQPGPRRAARELGARVPRGPRRRGAPHADRHLRRGEAGRHGHDEDAWRRTAGRVLVRVLAVRRYARRHSDTLPIAGRRSGPRLLGRGCVMPDDVAQLRKDIADVRPRSTRCGRTGGRAEPRSPPPSEGTGGGDVKRTDFADLNARLDEMDRS